MATNVMNAQLPHIVSRGHTRPLTEINFVEDGPDRTLLVSSAHDKLPQLRNGKHNNVDLVFRGALEDHLMSSVR